VVADSVRSEGDTLTVSTRKGNDTIDAHLIATDRAALKILAAEGNDVLRGSRFDDVLDGGAGSDTYTGDLGLDEFFDASPSTDIDRLEEDLSQRAETTGADIGPLQRQAGYRQSAEQRGQCGLRGRQERRLRTERRWGPLASDATSRT
jgi:Ca2+-binding RTX toxin-like protein